MKRRARAWHRYRRQNRFLVIAFLALMVLAAAAAYLVQRTQEASPRDLTNRLLLFVLWYWDISLIVVILFVLLRSIIRLALERRSGILGSRFRTKLVLTYVALTFIPVIFIFLIATNFLQRSIDRWFSAPVEEVLRGGAAVTEEARALVEDRLRRQAEAAAVQLRNNPDPARLDQLHDLLGVDLIALYRGSMLVQAVTEPRRIPRSLPPIHPGELRRAGHRADRWRGGLLIRAWAPIRHGNTVVMVGDMLPRDVLLHLERATAAYATFQEMKLQRGSVTSTTLLVLLAITLLLLFATVWVGLYLSRRFTEPLLAVAAATQRVAEGDQLEEVSVPATDEVAVLVHSFNAMVRRVRAKEDEILASNQELATLLATIPTGVLTVDAERRMVRANPAADHLLGWTLRDTWRPVEELDQPGLAPLHRVLSHPAAHTTREIDIEVQGVVRHLEVTAEPLHGGGWVVALEDLTQLVRAQRQAAWSEVARRIAHEIKNPLTPIRLAAERIQRHAAGLESKMQQVVTTGCDAIIAHVSGLKELVDAFYSYARMPVVNPRPIELSRLLTETVSLYEGLREEVRVELDLPADEIRCLADPALLRQALVNLLDNAMDAVGQRGEIHVAASVSNSDLVIEVADTGPGFATEDTALVMQPFYSTKGRGSGMGLALVHRVVTDHGGRLEVGNVRPHGARVTITLPGAVATAGDTDETARNNAGAPPEDPT
ncbi:MAG: HAMP domain-containing protein [Acidobacteria bacterium]|nr:HAMP domain-containing protein [Acidobacteriota bacterium]